MKVPTKGQLNEQIQELERLNQKMVEEKNREQVKRWNELLPQAYAGMS